MNGRVHIEEDVQGYAVVADGQRVFQGSWRECYEEARDRDMQFRDAYGPGEHVCDARPVADGGHLEFVAWYAAPGTGQAWHCAVCDEEFAKVGGSFYPASEMRHELQPEDVI